MNLCAAWLHPLAELEHATQGAGWGCFLLFAGLEVAVILWVVLACVRSRKASKARVRQMLEESEAEKETAIHPVLGSFWFRRKPRFGGARWCCEEYRSDVGCSLMVTGPGVEPTPAQIERLNEIERRMPEIIAAVPPPPDDDGWGRSFPDYPSCVLKPRVVRIRGDLGVAITIGTEPDPGDHYYLGISVAVTPDWRISAEWSL